MVRARSSPLILSHQPSGAAGAGGTGHRWLLRQCLPGYSLPRVKPTFSEVLPLWLSPCWPAGIAP
jgi:hypothetical protein